MKINCIILVAFFSILHLIESGPLRHRQERAIFYIANETACVVDDLVYFNGDPIPTDDPCESCKCRPPGFACVLEECEVKPGCRAVRRSGECCPEYVCGCEHNGKMYKDGEEIKDKQNPCYTCHCQGSAIACAFVDCFFRIDCAPEYVVGECCPQYDHCGPIDPSVHNISSGVPPPSDKPPASEVLFVVPTLPEATYEKENPGVPSTTHKESNPILIDDVPKQQEKDSESGKEESKAHATEHGSVEPDAGSVDLNIPLAENVNVLDSETVTPENIESSPSPENTESSPKEISEGYDAGTLLPEPGSTQNKKPSSIDDTEAAEKEAEPAENAEVPSSDHTADSEAEEDSIKTVPDDSRETVPPAEDHKGYAAGIESGTQEGSAVLPEETKVDDPSQPVSNQPENTADESTSPQKENNVPISENPLASSEPESIHPSPGGIEADELEKEHKESLYSQDEIKPISVNTHNNEKAQTYTTQTYTIQTSVKVTDPEPEQHATNSEEAESSSVNSPSEIKEQTETEKIPPIADTTELQATSEGSSEVVNSAANNSKSLQFEDDDNKSTHEENPSESSTLKAETSSKESTDECDDGEIEESIKATSPEGKENTELTTEGKQSEEITKSEGNSDDSENKNEKLYNAEVEPGTIETVTTVVEVKELSNDTENTNEKSSTSAPTNPVQENLFKALNEMINSDTEQTFTNSTTTDSASQTTEQQPKETPTEANKEITVETTFSKSDEYSTEQFKARSNEADTTDSSSHQTENINLSQSTETNTATSFTTTTQIIIETSTKLSNNKETVGE